MSARSAGAAYLAAGVAEVAAGSEMDTPVAYGPGATAVPVPAPPSWHRDVICAAWPFRDFMEFGSLSGAVPCARLHARQMLWEWDLAKLLADVELLVSELMTNAVAASSAAGQVVPVRLWLLADWSQVLVLVGDTSPRPPVQMGTGEDAEGGRGLLLVESISQQWDWYPSSAVGGKVVWALVAASD